MTPMRQTAFRIPDELLEAMERIRDRDGASLSWQVRKALEMWVESKGETISKAERKRVGPRKRS